MTQITKVLRKKTPFKSSLVEETTQKLGKKCKYKYKIRHGAMNI